MLDVRVTSEAGLAFLRAFTASAPKIVATVPAADEPTRVRLRDDLGWPVWDLDLSSSTDTALKRLQRSLFKEGAPAATGTLTNIEVFSAPGEGREVEIARRVLARLAKVSLSIASLFFSKSRGREIVALPLTGDIRASDASVLLPFGYLLQMVRLGADLLRLSSARVLR
jgi:hypothetical protein